MTQPVPPAPGPVPAPATAPAGPGVTYISFCAEITPFTVENLLAVCAQEAIKGTKTVYLMISTPGGSVAYGMTLFNTLRAMPFKLITHNMGNVDSIGNVVFLAGEERYSCPNATFMFHGVGFNLKEARLEEKECREKLDGILADQAKIAAVIRDRASDRKSVV